MRPRPEIGTGLAALAAACLAAAGCRDETHLGEDGFYAFALTEDTAPYAAAGDASLYLVEQRVELPVEPPSGDRLTKLSAQAEGKDLPFSRMPWVERGHYAIEVDWTIANLEDRPVTLEVVVNGFNEFHEYQPGFIVDDDEIISNFAQWERRLRLEPLERRTGTVREEAFDEMAVDLATVVNGAPNANQIVHPENDAATDDRAKPYIPEVIPALTGFRLGLRSQVAADVVLEASVRVRDEAGRIVAREKAWELPRPQTFMPAPMVE